MSYTNCIQRDLDNECNKHIYILTNISADTNSESFIIAYKTVMKCYGIAKHVNKRIG
jgi:hypothetical protein